MKRSIEKMFSFEKPFERKVSNHDHHEQDKLCFARNLGFDAGQQFTDEEEILLDQFYRINLYNIVWYRRRIKLEQKYVGLYLALTLIILTGIPALIFIATMTTWSDKIGVPELSGMEKIGSGLTVLLSSLLALHKFTSSWIDRKRFSANFHQASAELKDILYTLQSDFFGRSMKGGRSFPSQQKGRLLSDQFFNALRSAVQRSKLVVDAETKAYFEQKANPSFDIAGIWQSSVGSARNAFTGFKSGTWKLEELREQVKNDEAIKIQVAADFKSKEQQRQVNMLKLKRLGKQEELVSIQMDELESKLSSLNALQAARLEQLNSRWEKIQEEIEETEFNTEVLDMELAMLNLE